MLLWLKKISILSCSNIKCRLNILSQVANVWRCLGLKIPLALQVKIPTGLYTLDFNELNALHQIYMDRKKCKAFLIT